MFSKIGPDDTLSILGFLTFIVGIFLWLGLPASLIIAGLVMMAVGIRLSTILPSEKRN